MCTCGCEGVRAGVPANVLVCVSRKHAYGPFVGLRMRHDFVCIRALCNNACTKSVYRCARVRVCVCVHARAFVRFRAMVAGVCLHACVRTCILVNACIIRDYFFLSVGPK